MLNDQLGRQGTSHRLSDLGNDGRLRRTVIGKVNEDPTIVSSQIVTTGEDMKNVYAMVELMCQALNETSDNDLDVTGQFQNQTVPRFPQHIIGTLGTHTRHKSLMENMSEILTLVPEVHPDLPKWLRSLGAAYSNRFRCENDLNDLEKAIEYTSRAFDLGSESDQDRTKCITLLGELHGSRFRRLGVLDDLQKAMDYMKSSLALTPDEHPDLARCLGNLGMLHNDRFRRLGDISDCDYSIYYGLRAVELVSEVDGHPDRAKWLSYLSISHRDRFKHLNELSDLRLAIEQMSSAVDLTGERDPDHPHQLGNLGRLYRDLFQHEKNADLLHNAIDRGSRALYYTPITHPDCPKWLSSLGESYIDRFHFLKNPDDLEKAIDHMSRAVGLTPVNHPEMPHLLSSLGEFQGDRFMHSNNKLDLANAVKHVNKAIRSLPAGDPSLPSKLSVMAKLRFLQYNTFHDDFFLADALISFRKASQSLAGSPGAKFKAALSWASIATGCSPLNCLEAYQTAIDLLPQFIWLGATTIQRYENLSTAVNLALDAASAAAYYSKYELALEWLEHARCVVWNQSLMLRSPLDDLYSAHPQLATSLRKVAHDLNLASSQSRESRALASCSLTPEEAGQQHRRLAMQYDNLLSEARALPDFKDFLRPKKAGLLVQAARNGPIVVINCHREGSDALMILPNVNRVSHIFIENFSEKQAEAYSSRMRKALSSAGLRDRGFRLMAMGQGLNPDEEFKSILGALWDSIVKPVLEYLGYLRVSTEILPHITWCPTGLATFLPLHAAGDYDHPGLRALDYVMSSYTPMISPLLNFTPIPLNPGSSMLLVGQSSTYGFSPLPGVAKEIGCIVDHIKEKIQYSLLEGDRATRTAVLHEMGKHNCAHFACHASQAVIEPTKSGLYLHDGTLDLATMNQQPYKSRGLVFLSACQTAQGDQKLPDEAIHLGSAMLMAGYSSVIATMWSVMDRDASYVAEKVYAQLMKHGSADNGKAGRALHNAVADLREGFKDKNFARWVPYIHIGS